MAILIGKKALVGGSVSVAESSGIGKACALELAKLGAEEIGAVVAFLATPSASYVSGVNLPVDGGRTAGQ